MATGNRVFLEPVLAARAELPGVLGQLADVRASLPEAERGTVSKLVVQELRELDVLGRLRSAGRATDLSVSNAALRAKATMDRLRREVDVLDGQQAGIEGSQREALGYLDSLVATWTLILGLAGLLGGVAISGLFMARLVRRLRVVEANAQRLAAGEPLAPADLGRDEIASLGSAFDRAANLITDQRERLALAMELGSINVWHVDGDWRLISRGARAEG